MSSRTTGSAVRFDRSLRTVMWWDAFGSIAVVVVCVIATPIAATMRLPRSIVLAVGLAAIGSALLLAALGAITAVLLMVRMRTGRYLLPVGLRLPLPRPMRPDRPAPISSSAAS